MCSTPVSARCAQSVCATTNVAALTSLPNEREDGLDRLNASAQTKGEYCKRAARTERLLDN